MDIIQILEEHALIELSSIEIRGEALLRGFGEHGRRVVPWKVPRDQGCRVGSRSQTE
jgi:hypothetical protein